MGVVARRRTALFVEKERRKTMKIEHLREAFGDWVDCGMPPRPEVEGKLSQLLECSDIMSRFICDELNLRRGSTFGAAAQRLMAAMEPMRRALHKKREARLAEILRLAKGIPPEGRVEEFRASNRRSKV